MAVTVCELVCVCASEAVVVCVILTGGGTGSSKRSVETARSIEVFHALEMSVEREPDHEVPYVTTADATPWPTTAHVPEKSENMRSGGSEYAVYSRGR